MGKIGGADAIKAMTAFLGNANMAGQREQMRLEERERWEKQHALDLAANRRAQQQAEMYLMRNNFQHAMDMARWARETKDYETQQQIIETVKGMLGGMDPRVHELFYAAQLDEERLRTQKASTAGQNIYNQRQQNEMSRENTLWARQEETRRLVGQMLGKSPEEMKALEAKMGFESLVRTDTKERQEDANRREAEAAVRLQTGGFGGAGVSMETLKALDEAQRLIESRKGVKATGEAAEKYGQEHGETPEYAALVQSLQSGTGGDRQLSQLMDIARALEQTYHVTDPTTMQSVWTSAEAQKSHDAIMAAVAAEGETMAKRRMGLDTPPPGGAQVSAGNPILERMKAKSEDDAKDNKNESAGSKKYSRAMAEFGGTPGEGPADAFGVWFGGNYPTAANAIERITRRNEERNARLWNETPIGGPFSQAGRDFMWQFTPMGFMEGFGQGLSEIFPKPEWYR